MNRVQSRDEICLSVYSLTMIYHYTLKLYAFSGLRFTFNMTNGPYREWMQRKSAGQKQDAFDVFASVNLQTNGSSRRQPSIEVHSAVRSGSGQGIIPPTHTPTPTPPHPPTLKTQTKIKLKFYSNSSVIICADMIKAIKYQNILYSDIADGYTT